MAGRVSNAHPTVRPKLKGEARIAQTAIRVIVLLRDVRSLHRTGGGLLHGQPGRRRPLGHPGGHSARGSRREQADARQGGERGSPAERSLSLPPHPLTHWGCFPAHSPTNHIAMATDHDLRAPPGGKLSPRGNAPPHPHLPRPLAGPPAAPRGPRLQGEQRDLGSPGGLAAGLQDEGVAAAAPSCALHKGDRGQDSRGSAAGHLLCGPAQSRPALSNPHNKPVGGCCDPRFTGLPTGPR